VALLPNVDEATLLAERPSRGDPGADIAVGDRVPEEPGPEAVAAIAGVAAAANAGAAGTVTNRAASSGKGVMNWLALLDCASKPALHPRAPPWNSLVIAPKPMANSRFILATSASDADLSLLAAMSSS
jgi:hypothetical protein